MKGARRLAVGAVGSARRGLALLALLAAGACAGGPTPATPGSRGAVGGAAAPEYGLVPAPRYLEPGPGHFAFGPETSIVLPVAHASLAASVEVFAAPLRAVAGIALPVVGASGGPGGGGSSGSAGGPGPGPASGDVVLRLIAGDTVGTSAEGYRLAIDAEGIDLAATTPAGLFRGLMRLRQLLPPEYERGVRSRAPWGQTGGPAPALLPDGTPVQWSVPALLIDDEPRFAWRGMHLDVGRHFFEVDFIKKYIDLLALHGLNTFHWHLTEDQGWRVEIEAYPRLTWVGSCRRETMVAQNFDPYVGDGERYCGFYTQAEIRDVVAYAAERHITVVPEIEMPGHSLAALAAYPELACTEGPFEVGTRWGVYEDIYCPSEETFAFLETVLGEVLELFPSEFIHIGGDEAPKARWRESPLAQEVIRREGLADEDELQSWFIGRIESFLDARGRRLIGWDEILEGGLAPGATVMSWRGEAGGIAAARQGHDAVMTPNSHLYFDHYQADPEVHDEPLAICCLSTLRQVWDYDPVPDSLSAAEARHILGAQANLWTEYMKTPDHVEYMALPRMAALSEVVWGPAEFRGHEAGWVAFRGRLERHLARLRELGVRYRPPDVPDEAQIGPPPRG